MNKMAVSNPPEQGLSPMKRTTFCTWSLGIVIDQSGETKRPVVPFKTNSFQWNFLFSLRLILFLCSLFCPSTPLLYLFFFRPLPQAAKRYLCRFSAFPSADCGSCIPELHMASGMLARCAGGYSPPPPSRPSLLNFCKIIFGLKCGLSRGWLCS